METSTLSPAPLVPRYGHPACGDDANARAKAEVCAAIAMVARHPAYRVVVCGMATSASLLFELDPLAAEAGVVLERRIRAGGRSFDVVIRAA